MQLVRPNLVSETDFHVVESALDELKVHVHRFGSAFACEVIVNKAALSVNNQLYLGVVVGLDRQSVDL